MAPVKVRVSPRSCTSNRETGEVYGRAAEEPRYLSACGGTGVGEVIKGWDKGVEGMRVGDKRKITVRRTPATSLVAVSNAAFRPPLLPWSQNS